MISDQYPAPCLRHYRRSSRLLPPSPLQAGHQKAHHMVDNKYIGLAMAVVGSFAIGTSSVITKMVCHSAVGPHGSADGTASTDNMAYLRNSMWGAGMGTLVVGEAANFGAYTFAPPIMVTPLGALSVIVG
ncbi:magnesium transporter NIPA-domain-containing protein, partial [Mycena olivaceomarginata]